MEAIFSKGMMSKPLEQGILVKAKCLMTAELAHGHLDENMKMYKVLWRRGREKERERKRERERERERERINITLLRTISQL